MAGATFLVMAIFGLVPVRFKVGDKEVWVAREALRAIAEVAKATDVGAQEEIVARFEEGLEAHGVPRDHAQAVESMLVRFERYSGSPNARLVHDALVAMGWQPSVPPKSTYIRWSYTGRKTVSLFQRSGSLAVATVHARDYAKRSRAPLTVPRTLCSPMQAIPTLRSMLPRPSSGTPTSESDRQSRLLRIGDSG